MKYNSGAFLLALDLLGTFVFAVEGNGAADAADRDFLGVMVLTLASALGGGIVRDLLELAESTLISGKIDVCSYP